jgi:hypothetical protein
MEALFELRFFRPKSWGTRFGTRFQVALPYADSMCITNISATVIR